MLKQFKTKAGVHVEYSEDCLNYKEGIESLIERLDSQRGAVFASSFDYPERYTCWDIGFCNPPMALICSQEHIRLEALNQRGEVLMSFLYASLLKQNDLELISHSPKIYQLKLRSSNQLFSEEERSLQPSVFSMIRFMLDFFKSTDEPYLGLYGAFGFDLIYQFEELTMTKARSPSQRELVLYFPDEIYIVNHRKEEACVRRYDFQYQGKSTQGLVREGIFSPYKAQKKPQVFSELASGEYAKIASKAKDYFSRGDLFEVVPSQAFYTHFTRLPSDLFRQMRQANPSPYGFFINLGDEEYLVGASPEMYVRVTGKRVETCPISGTIRRGANAIEDAENIQTLLDSEKEKSELTMCTDVDRNDKSRICEPKSVKIIGRRQIELYSRVIHTVDHVEGYLREGFDAVDAFLTHMWVVTVTGAPKLWALEFIEEHEKLPRKWYAGAVGWFSFDGNLNTGLILRTVQINQGVAEIRVGATLLYDSIPEAEEEETRLKASVFLELLQNTHQSKRELEILPLTGKGKEVLLIDHEDSFVHTLANYFRQTGAGVKTIRYDKALTYLQKQNFDLVVLSPGPGKPSDFHLSNTINVLIQQKIPIFGVCLGLQGIVEYFGGLLDTLDYPMHGKSSKIKLLNKEGLFFGLADEFQAGRYHSLYARLKSVPAALEISAISDDGIVMAVAHHDLPIYAVQFHPEALLTLPNQAGLKIITNLMRMIG